MMIRLTNSETGDEGKLLALNARYIEAVYVVFEQEGCRITMDTGRQYIVQETFDQVIALIPPSNLQ